MEQTIQRSVANRTAPVKVFQRKKPMLIDLLALKSFALLLIALSLEIVLNANFGYISIALTAILLVLCTVSIIEFTLAMIALILIRVIALPRAATNVFAVFGIPIIDRLSIMFTMLSLPFKIGGVYLIAMGLTIYTVIVRRTRLALIGMPIFAGFLVREVREGFGFTANAANLCIHSASISLSPVSGSASSRTYCCSGSYSLADVCIIAHLVGVFNA